MEAASPAWRDQVCVVKKLGLVERGLVWEEERPDVELVGSEVGLGVGVVGSRVWRGARC